MSPESAAPKEALFAHCDAALGGAASYLFVPGRIEVLGKHTDYAGGRSLLCAVEQGFCVAYRPRSEPVFRVHDVVRHEVCEVPMSAERRIGKVRGWANYVATAVHRLARDFPELRCGADVAIASDLPPSSGMSSSSALVVVASLVAMEANALPQTARYAELFPSLGDLAGYLGAVENGRAFGGLAGDAGVGTFGGSEDHTAVLCCLPATISQYSFAPVRHERDVAVPAGFTFVVGVSGVRANKTGAALGAYNRVSLAATRILRGWNEERERSDATLAAAVHTVATETGATRPAELCAPIAAGIWRVADREFSADYLRGRLDQFVEESEVLVPRAADALARDAVSEFGAIVDRSQQLAETNLHNQVRETVHLQRSARELGAVAASAFGAGFGGSVWAMVPAAKADEFAQQWGEVYRTSHPGRASQSGFRVARAGPSALRW